MITSKHDVMNYLVNAFLCMCVSVACIVATVIFISTQTFWDVAALPIALIFTVSLSSMFTFNAKAVRATNGWHRNAYTTALYRVLLGLLYTGIVGAVTVASINGQELFYQYLISSTLVIAFLGCVFYTIIQAGELVDTMKSMTNVANCRIPGEVLPGL